jgi:hypothetical protein
MGTTPRALVALFVLAVASTAVGCGSGASQEEQLTRDVTRTFEGITCTWPANLSEGAAICRLANGAGLATVLAKRLVMVRNFRSRKVVFTRNQPEHSSAYGRSSDKRVTHQETHQGITCYWSGVGGGAAFCNRADERGYSAGLSPVAALVLSDKSKVIFLRNQP